MRSSALSFAAAIPFVYIVLFALAAIVHIAFAAGVGADANRFRAKQLSTFLVGPGMWAFATLIGGVWVALAYWIIHHSNLRAIQPPWEREKDRESAADHR